jgi:hypothetical protein
MIVERMSFVCEKPARFTVRETNLCEVSASARHLPTHDRAWGQPGFPAIVCGQLPRSAPADTLRH